MNKIKSKVPNVDTIAAQLRGLVLKGQYKKGSELAKKILKSYPDDFYFSYQYAKLLGDWADDLPTRQQKVLKVKSAKILKPLTRKLSGQPSSLRCGVCLNYYYQTHSFHSMYKYGKRFVKTDKKLGHYAQALGAGLFAEEKLTKGYQSQAKQWASRSVNLWNKYGLRTETYYFPFYNLAMSWTILGQPEKALVHLKRAAKLSNRSVKCEEFAKLYQLIQQELKK